MGSSGSGLDYLHPDLFGPSPESESSLDHVGKQVAASSNHSGIHMRSQLDDVHERGIKARELVQDISGSSSCHELSWRRGVLLHERFFRIRQTRMTIRIGSRENGWRPQWCRSRQLKRSVRSCHEPRPPLALSVFRDDDGLC